LWLKQSNHIFYTKRLTARTENNSESPSNINFTGTPTLMRVRPDNFNVTPPIFVLHWNTFAALVIHIHKLSSSLLL